MPDPAPRLPARPSLAQLRKQAKERLAALRAADPAATLARAQYLLALDYGFESWPKLVRHLHDVESSGRIELFARLADDLLAGWHRDPAALGRLIAHYGASYSPDQLYVRVRSRVDDARATIDRDEEPSTEPTLEDVRRMLAREYGFETWENLTRGLAQPSTSSVDRRTGMSAAPPFYRIDHAQRTIEPRAPLSERDWDAVFEVMREHGLTGIVTPAITDSGLRKLSRLGFVTRIELDGARGITDDGVLQLARMPQLESLDLSGFHGPITDRGLEVLRHLPSLRSFKMCWAQHVTDEGAAHLAACERLERVDLMGTPTGDGLLRALAGKTRLRTLKTGARMTDAGLPLLQSLPVFAAWQGGEARYHLLTFEPEPNHLLLGGAITDRGIAGLAGLDGVFGLGFSGNAASFTGAGLAALGDLPNLGFLALPGERCDDAAMHGIANLPALRMLLAQGAVAGDEGFASLARSRTLEYLWCRECPNLGGSGFAALAEMPALRGLGVSCAQVDDAGLATLPRFPALRQLMPMDVPDAGFRHVGQCEKLKSLICMYCRDTGDAATEHIAGLRLKRYYAGKTRITDRSLEILGRMPSLESIELWETAGISDAGLPALAKLPHLREITISGAPRVTRHGLGILPSTVRVRLDP